MWLHLLAVMVGVALGLWLMAEDNLDSLKGKRVLVTGASGGLGEQLAYVYAEHGATVVVTARRQAELDKVSAKCRKLSPSNASHLAVSADMKDFNSIQDLINKAIGHMGGLDILALNHITKTDMNIFTGSQRNLDNIYNTMDVNFKSYVQTAALALPHLTDSEGGLVVINSLMGSVHGPTLAPYVASKFALNGFFGSLRNQFYMEGRKVAVTSCVLGFIDTPNAVQGLRKSGSTRILRLVRPVSASGTARAIAGASARREEVLYHPSLTNWLFLWLNRMWPSLGDFLIRELARE